MTEQFDNFSEQDCNDFLTRAGDAARQGVIILNNLNWFKAAYPDPATAPPAEREAAAFQRSTVMAMIPRMRVIIDYARIVRFIVGMRMLFGTILAESGRARETAIRTFISRLAEWFGGDTMAYGHLPEGKLLVLRGCPWIPEVLTVAMEDGFVLPQHLVKELSLQGGNNKEERDNKRKEKRGNECDGNYGHSFEL
ncbi:hypothetical protein TWF730_001880 [Orbilia blumenaviensis]|uniref:Uncharacterized protein n=1 Tax=Orbilia blumenaviensis TaxID=1796055 RepID=A0AAV9UG45_9PEZI